MTHGPGQFPQPMGASSPQGQIIPSLPAYPVRPPQMLPTLPAVTSQGRSADLWLFGVLGVITIAVVTYFTLAIGALPSFVGFILALFPLAIVFIGAFLVDRWEREPWSLLLFAVLWGAVASIAFALLADLLMSSIFPETETRQVLRAVVQAPIVEELGKGLGLLIIFFVGRRAFDGPLDGLVYGMLIAAGFAFTENIQYFAQSLNEGGEMLMPTFFMRGLQSPFAHAMFTSVTGIAVGIAAQRGRKGNVGGMFALGLLGAMILHALWNGSALVGNFQVLYFVVQVPLFIIFIIAIIMLRREEAKLTRTRLSDYVAAGWFTPQEVSMLATSAGRREGLRWASSLPGNKRHIMKQFIRDAAQLASTRQRAVSGRDPQASADEWALLGRTASERQALLSR